MNKHINEAYNFINFQSKKLNEDIILERLTINSSTQFGVNIKDDSFEDNKKFITTGHIRYTYFYHDDQLFKFIITKPYNEIKFGIFNENYKDESDRFLIGEKLPVLTNFNMITFWPKILFIVKSVVTQFDYDFISFSSVEHTHKLYKAFMNNKYFLELINSMGFIFDEEVVIDASHSRYMFRNKNKKNIKTSEINPQEKFLNLYQQFKSKFPKFAAAYPSEPSEIMKMSTEEIESIIQEIEGMLDY